MSSPVLRTLAPMKLAPSGLGPILVAISHDRAILEYPLTVPQPSIKTNREEKEAIVVNHPPPGACNCCHSGLSVEELPLDLEYDEEISDVQLQVNIMLFFWNPRPIKHNSPSWSVEQRIPLTFVGRGSTISQLSPCKTSITFNNLLIEPNPPATTKTSGDLVLTEDVPYLLVGIAGSEGSHCSPVVLVRSSLVTSRVEG